MLLDVALTEDVLRDNGRFVARQRHQYVGGWVGELENRRVGVRRFNIRHLPERVGAAGMDLFQHLQNAELHIGAGQRLAVVERHVPAQLEGDGLAVLADGPGFRQARLRLEVEIVFKQTVEDLCRYLPDGAGGAEIGGEGGRLRLDHHDQRSAALLCMRGGRHQKTGDHQRQDASYHRSYPPLARISQTPRPCVPAARMFRLGLSFNSTTWAFGKPVPNTDQCKPKSIDEKTPRSVPK